jgi:hypothetical protein
VPLVPPGEVDPVEEPGLVGVVLPAVPIAVLEVQSGGGVLAELALGVRPAAAGLSQLAGFVPAVAEPVVARVLVAEVVSVAVGAEAGVCGVTVLIAFPGCFGRPAGLCWAFPAGGEACCTAGGVDEASGAAALAATVPSTDDPCPTPAERLA